MHREQTTRPAEPIDLGDLSRPLPDTPALPADRRDLAIRVPALKAVPDLVKREAVFRADTTARRRVVERLLVHDHAGGGPGAHSGIGRRLGGRCRSGWRSELPPGWVLARRLSMTMITICRFRGKVDRGLSGESR